MIIKKGRLPAYATAKPASESRREARSDKTAADWDAIEAEAQSKQAAYDPYAGEIAPEKFETGELPDRRQNNAGVERRIDRRHGYRRLEDQELISLAHEEANAIREAAAQEGYQAGLDQANDVISTLDDAIKSFYDAREDALTGASRELAAMAVKIAEKVIHTEVSCDDELVMSVVYDTIRRVDRDQKQLTVKVHPADAKLVKQHLKEDDELANGVSVQVVEEETIEAGSCMVESRAGLIDARFSTQLDVLNRLLARGGIS